MNKIAVILLGIVHSVSGLLALLSIPFSLLGGFTLGKISSLAGLFLAIYFISGIVMVHETYVTVMEANSIYSSTLEKFRTYVESHPVNSPVYLYGYQNLRILTPPRDNQLKMFLVLLVFSVINQVPFLNIIPLTYYLGGEYSRIRNLMLLQSQLGLGGKYVPDQVGMEILTIITNGFTFGFMVSRLHSLSQTLVFSPPSQGQGPGLGNPFYGGGTPSP
ncbi:hypothetical protein HA72_0542 [Metallosphaera sedula]|uniref:Uncharacterized protein n=3 Tax=Metallosphaera TaxID=41980 RepID=A4YE65_METS5|nr:MULTISPECIES: hypothetical protein [Metallosphaera]ABP94717.1 hypothetical protein Msed_0542 [Metallosphaera sedula DSM 5348]AIM26704.1 hypothetical protein HA72_0542 [Metallosphaera sedula]QCO29739.1 hypothetical protein DFR88_03880 [Metallosphaera prunae]WPX06752.1 hypothetical protein SOJ17_000469 [Metallosphaera sedula DSM 5348]